jgi:hypothetical protein
MIAQFYPAGGLQNTAIPCISNPKLINSDMEELPHIHKHVHAVINTSGICNIYVGNYGNNNNTASTFNLNQLLMATNVVNVTITHADIEIVRTQQNALKMVVVFTGHQHFTNFITNTATYIYDFDFTWTSTSFGPITLGNGVAGNAVANGAKDPQIDGLPNDDFAISYTDVNDQIICNYYNNVPGAGGITLQTSNPVFAGNGANSDIAFTRNLNANQYFLNVVYTDLDNLTVVNAQNYYTQSFVKWLAYPMPIIATYSLAVPYSVVPRVCAPRYTNLLQETEFAVTYAEKDAIISQPFINYFHADNFFLGTPFSSGTPNLFNNSVLVNGVTMAMFHDRPNLEWTDHFQDAVLTWNVSYIKNGVTLHFANTSQFPYAMQNYNANYIASTPFFANFNPNNQGTGTSICTPSIPLTLPLDQPLFSYIVSFVNPNANFIRVRYNQQGTQNAFKINTPAKEKDLKVSLYPNPATSTITLEINDINGIITIYDMMGKIVHSQTITDNVSTMDISGFSKGFYSYDYAVNGEKLTGRIIFK